MFCQKLIKNKIIKNKKGVALFIVLAAMATLAIFVGEITYTAQINQKLAYDRLDQIKATSLAKSGLRIALLRIKAYSELQKQVGALAKAAGANASDVSSVVPKGIMEKIWSEPITVPFTGDISALPGAARDAMNKFRKESGMEGRLYIAITAQSAKMNLNSTLSAFAPSPTASPSPSPGGQPANATPSASPTGYVAEQARQHFTDQLKDTFQKKFDDDQQFRDQYRSLRIEDLADEIIGWSDISYTSSRAQYATVPFKLAPFYHVSELRYLPSMDDEIYDLLSPQFTAGVNSSINVNTILEPVLTALVPQMTKEELKKFFDYREGKTDLESSGQNSGGGATASAAGDKDNSFKTADEFFKYLQDKVAALNSEEKVKEFRKALTSRGIQIITEESNFVVRIEATVQQTKRTLEAMVTILPSGGTPSTPTSPNGNPSPTPMPQGPTVNGLNSTEPERSNLKVTQLRFL